MESQKIAKLSEPLTPQEEAEIRARLERAAPGPWRWRQDYEMGRGVKHWELSNPESDKEGRTIDASLILLLDSPDWLGRSASSQPNWELIAHAPEDISRLLDTLAVLREENERLRKLVKDGSY